MPHKKVDILLATYNGEKFLSEQIESLQKQSYRDWKLLVSDDCSSDRTVELVKKYAESDYRINVISENKKFGGPKNNFLHLLRNSKADYVLFCDQDDVWLPDKIQKTVEKLQKLDCASNPIPNLVFTDMKVVDERLNVISPSFMKYTATNQSRIKLQEVIAQPIGAGCTMGINRCLANMVNRTPFNAYMVMHDYWISLVAAAFGHIVFLNEATLLYRQHGSNSLGADNFSIIKRLLHPNSMTRHFYETVQQAKSFLDVYGSELSKKDYESLSRYSNLLNDRGFIAMSDLLLSGCWKKRRSKSRSNYLRNSRKQLTWA